MNLILHRPLLLLSLAASTSALSQMTSPLPTSPGNQCNVRVYGAKGDNVALDTTSINAAVAACASRGGGVVVVPPGTYRTGTIRLLDHIDLHLEAGATILGSPDVHDYLPISKASEDRNTALILAENAHDVAVTGEGIIDGNGPAFTLAESLSIDGRPATEGPAKMKARPGVLMLMLHTDGITLKGFHVRDSPNWGVKLMCSEHIVISDLDIRNGMLVPNSDALDISNSTNAVISNSYLEAGDDALVIGGPCADGWCQQLTQNVAVNNVILRSRSSALRIGPSAGGVRNLVFSNVIIHDTNRGIAIQARDAETIENILFDNVVSETHLIDGPWWGSGEPISITVAKWAYGSWSSVKPPVATPGIGQIRHLRFSHVVMTGAAPVVLYSTGPGRIDDVQFDDVHLTMQPGSFQAVHKAQIDMVPSDPEMIGTASNQLAAILAYNTSGLAFRDLQVDWQSPFPTSYKNALNVERYNGLTIQGFRGEANLAGSAAIRLRQGNGLVLSDAKARHGLLLDTLPTR